MNLPPPPPGPSAAPGSGATWWKVLLIVGVSLAVLALLAVAGLWWLTGAPERRARDRIAALGAPAGFQRDGADNVSGNWACLDACIEVTRYWRAEGLDEAEVKRLAVEHVTRVAARQKSWRVQSCSDTQSCTLRIEVDNNESAIIVDVYTGLGEVRYVVSADS